VLPTPIWVAISAVNITLFMSLTHEVVHGHPTRISRLNSLLVVLPIGWSIPFERFRDTHIAHHDTSELTDPFDDPESWYLAGQNWDEISAIKRCVLVFNNTLFGRMAIGPLLGLGRYYWAEIAILICKPAQRRYVFLVWAKHIALCAVMAWAYIYLTHLAAWQVLLSIYLGHSLLYVRTFLEHQAAPDHSERTVIIEKACPIAFLFLFNNYHFVHHLHPGIPWYKLPRVYHNNREEYLARNGAYVYRSYMGIFRKYFLSAKDPVAHPFLRKGQ